MATAGLLAQYMSIKSQLSYYELQDTKWNNLSTAMSKKLSEQENLQSKWEDSSGALYDDWGSTKEYKANGTVFQSSNGAVGAKLPAKDKPRVCELYAYAKVKKFDSDKLDEYTDLDMEYSTMVAMYDTLVEELQAMADGTKEQLSTEAQDTHLIQ